MIPTLLRRLSILFIWVLPYITIAQRPEKPNTSEIYEAIQKLNVLGSVLYVAAHPDDENTKLIAYLSNHVKANTTYLSLTRGDGGQNLIGPEIRELLGVIRTQELVTARAIDGGTQAFSRANDFGYSKHPEETLSIWNKEEVLSDVVRAIRKLRPDVIINRFDHRTPGTTHGHHTASAMLSLEAFDLVGKTTAYPEQLNQLETWQPKRVFFNTSWWFYGSKEKFNKANKAKFLEIDTGIYYPSYGVSNSEIAALSRSQHQSQGFGTMGTRGSEPEYLEPIKGSFPKNGTSIFEGIDISWNRVKGGAPIGELVQTIQSQFDFKAPEASLPLLLQAYQKIQQLDDQHWKQVKTKEIEAIIMAITGIYLEAVAKTPYTTPGSSIDIAIEAINRSQTPIQLTSIYAPALGIPKQPIATALSFNKGLSFTYTGAIDNNASSTNPYWLEKPATLGMYTVSDAQLIGLPNTPHHHTIVFTLDIDGTPMTIERPVVYKKTDPVRGEVYQPFEVIPNISVALENRVLIFPDTTSKEIVVNVTPHKDSIKATLKLQHPKGWQVTPNTVALQLGNKEESTAIRLTITPPAQAAQGELSPMVTYEGKQYTKSKYEIAYPHIPKQTVVLPAVSKLVRLSIAKKGQRIGYIHGAGDAVPESLRHIGYDVTVIDPKTITTETLQKFDAIVLGVRAYNTIDILPLMQKYILEYVQQGGTVITQYNTSHRLKVTDNLGPFPLELSRDRVTDEHAKITILAPEHPILNTPNPITAKDFEGWVQERGLYFPKKWDNAYTPLLAAKDPGESTTKGSLLVAPYGKGYYIYTGLSFFRQLPAGVSGAYRLFANMLSIGK